MPQRKEKSDKSGHQESFSSLLTLLESPEPDVVDSVKNIIQENLSGTKDSKPLNNIVDFYTVSQSKSCFEVLLHLKDPHDKHLFDKINEMMKDADTKYNALQLLVNIVYKQPTWLHKIANHRLMTSLLAMLKNEMDCPNLLSGLFILICLLPTIPHLFGHLLHDVFYIFSRFAAWNIRKPNSLSEVLNLYLQTGIYSLFHRLYGMFPCNFLAYLRSFYGGRDCLEENAKVFSLVIKPMLERVRLHPLLITASKETELSVNRWKKMAYHDIIVECASVSFDTIEGTLENLKKLDSSTSSQCEIVSSYESANEGNFHSQSVDLGSAVNDISLSNQELIWSPAQTCITVAPICSPNISSPTGEFEFTNAMQSSTEEVVPLDFAIEAKPEVLKCEMSGEDLLTETHLLEDNIETDLTPLMKRNLSNDKDEDIDKEVSELTSNERLEQSLAVNTIRHDTPFCSTTQTLTAEPVNLTHCEKSENESKADEIDEVYNSMQEADLMPYVATFTRSRYLSQCGPPPDIQPTIRKIQPFRCKSCPPTFSLEEDSVSFKSIIDKNLKETQMLSYNTNIITPSPSAFISLNKEKPAIPSDNFPVYQHLLPSTVYPLQGFEQPIVGLSSKQSRGSKSLSPPELLDHYIQQSNNTYLSNLPLTSKRDTDWTHFGGKPPTEEIEILRNQILLLHNILLFERHRKDVHSEHNRSILGRAKRHKMHEEMIESLKTDINTLFQEKSNLKKELNHRHRLHQQLECQKNQMKDELESKIFKSCQENEQLVLSKKQMQTLLVNQKEENDEIRELYKKAQCDVAASKCKLKHAKQELEQCQRFKKETVFLTKQLVMMQELNSLYKNKIEQMKKPQADSKDKYLNNTLLAEIEVLKENLDAETIFLDSAKGKIIQLENVISDMKVQQKENISVCEKTKQFHENEIMVRDDRLKDLQKISVEKNSYILTLHVQLDELKSDNDSLKNQLKELQQIANCKHSNNGLQPQIPTGCDKITSDENSDIS